MATMIYGEARFTNDVDIVADFQTNRITPLLNAFPGPEFYLSETAIRDAINRRFQFYVIHPGSGLKIDFMVPRDDPFNQSRLSRGVLIELDENGRSARFASAEDAILMKLKYFREGGSEKHLRDIPGVLRIQEARDQTYLKDWAMALGVAHLLEEVLSE